MKHFRLFIFLVVIAAVLAASDVAYLLSNIGGKGFFAPANAAASVRVDEYGTCRMVTNNNGANLFIPAQSAGEWNSLVANGAPNVVLSACAPITCALPWGGTLADGASITAYKRVPAFTTEQTYCGSTIPGGPYTSTCNSAADIG